LRQARAAPLDPILKGLPAEIPGLATWLAQCSADQAEKLAEAIRAAKALKGKSPLGD